MSSLIGTANMEYRLFRQPHKLGDVIEINDKMLLIIGIQRFELWGHRLQVWYTCQNLQNTSYVSKKKAYKQPFQLHAEMRVRYDDERLEKAKLGTVHKINGEYYQIMEYTDITIEGTDLIISFTVKPVYPLDRKEAKAKYVYERKKKLKLEVF
ncbi:hypothetical protein [Thermaerobacillus caldiproteolyticus]|uniref:hypothetical protein n=1 Tax=Thermaerobacillus caldiproteolyticus TaxID=247480 RepID=UPI0018F1C5A4|nr:hypothetical protein [Anoxybacillus caldiproteolyticus]